MDREGCFGYDFLSENHRIYLVVASWPNPLVCFAILVLKLPLGCSEIPFWSFESTLDDVPASRCCLARTLYGLTLYVRGLTFVRRPNLDLLGLSGSWTDPKRLTKSVA